MTVPVLAWVNVVLYVLQLFVNGHAAQRMGPIARRYETLLTPAPSAFRIWSFIYLCLAATVLTDCLWPTVSVYAHAPHANVLRTAFAVSCVMNMAWIGLFTHEYVNVATLVLVVLWGSLFLLYASIVTARRDTSVVEARRKRFWLSELGLVLYFAWSSVATVISVAVSAQSIANDYLSFTFYSVLLSLLVVVALSIVIYEGDVVVGLVAIWALGGLAAKHTTFEPRVEIIAMNIRACAAQCAAIIAAFVVMSSVRKLQFAPPTQLEQQHVQSSAPLSSNKSDYGTTDT